MSKLSNLRRRELLGKYYGSSKKRQLKQKRYTDSPYCYYCESHLEPEEVTIDHYWPTNIYPELAQNEDNMVLSCHACNTFKGDKDPNGYTPTRFKKLIATGSNSFVLERQLDQYSGSVQPKTEPLPLT